MPETAIIEETVKEVTEPSEPVTPRHGRPKREPVAQKEAPYKGSWMIAHKQRSAEDRGEILIEVMANKSRITLKVLNRTPFEMDAPFLAITAGRHESPTEDDKLIMWRHITRNMNELEPMPNPLFDVMPAIHTDLYRT